MRHLRPVLALVAIVLITTACSSPAATSGEEGGQPAEATEPAATATGGGGGGGGGANGSITYELTGDVAKAGELPFVYLSGGASMFAEGGWVAYFYSDATPDLVIQINSNPTSNILNYGDGENLVVGTEDVGCTFNYSQNDASGLKGTIDCPTTVSSKIETGALTTVQLHATVDAHP